MGEKRFVKNTVPGKQRGKKYPPDVRSAALFDCIMRDNVHEVAQKHGIPESTLRDWYNAELASPAGGANVWQEARREEAKKLAVRAAQGAGLSMELMLRRLEIGARELEEVERIDAEHPGQITDDELRAERAKRKGKVPNDFTLANFARAFTSISAKAGTITGAEDGAGSEPLEITIRVAE